ncbi:MAG: type II CRISPR RNA-guided endonuclease Cas9 [Bacteroidota bacterium]
MKRILGLDLGSASIGWALISENEINGNVKREILGLGCRIIPYEGNEGKEFEKGTGKSRNSIRTQMRTMRKGYDRYQLRRKYLVQELIKHNMYPTDELKGLPKMQLWELRNRAATEKVSLTELGRILLWLNQKRGYKSSRSDSNLDKKDTEYVAKVKSRHQLIKEQNLTIGQYFYQQLQNDQFFRVKENVFPREAYIEEFDTICNVQKKHYPNILTEELISKIRDEIIYYQRPLKSQKGLVSVCEFEGFWRKGPDGKEYFVGPKVAPRSSPIFQYAKIWENINNIKIENKQGNNIEITLEQKRALFEHLDNNEKLTTTDIVRILGLKKNECFFNKQLAKGITGNITKCAILNCFDDYSKYAHLVKFEVDIIETTKNTYLYDKSTGEVINEKTVKYIHPKIEKEPLYVLWHTIYSIPDQDECSRVLQDKFGIEKDIADKLASIDFTKQGFGNKSAKTLRKILPYLMEGDGYSEAMCYAGYNHSNSLTKDENLKRELQEKLKPIPKNSLRQPIVEKILNQMVNVVNAIIDKYGKPDEIRVELARELKQSKEERNETFKRNNEKERENAQISKKLEEFGLRATRNNILKWRLYEEMDNEDKKLNAICIYCGQPISLVEAIKGADVDIEHIIPKSKLFDDSQSNKTLAHRHCNTGKGDLTAYDFMKSKPTEVFNAYLERVAKLYANKVISKAKRDKLLMTESKIPDNFIDRQLRESQYIAKKAREILQTISHNVWTTSGSVTAELRRLWGWDDVTMNLQFNKYKELGLTSFVEWESEHGKNKHSKEVITGWSKRDDHRHHAVDALVIACTKQGYIQRFNTLNSSKTKEDLIADVEKRSIQFKEKLSLLEKYIVSEQPFTVKEVEDKVAGILVSFKAGKKVAVIGKRKVGKKGNKKVVQTGILIPRGELHEEGVYGIICRYKKDSRTQQIIFEDKVVKKYKIGIGTQGFLFTGKETYEIKEKTDKKTGAKIKIEVDKIQKVLDSIVDDGVKRAILRRLNLGFENGKSYKDDVKRALDNLKNLENSPIYLNESKRIPIKTVRCFTGLSAVVPVKKDENGNNIGFVKPGNNHHIAIYTDSEGNKHEHVCTFWHAVERKKFGFPVIIKNTNEVWDKIQEKPDGTYPEEFLEKLPSPNLTLELSMQQNEMFVLGMTREEFADCMTNNDYKAISNKLYRVQKLGSNDYNFRHHLETEIINDENAKMSKRFFRIASINGLLALNPVKVKIDCIGNITAWNNTDRV